MSQEMEKLADAIVDVELTKLAGGFLPGGGILGGGGGPAPSPSPLSTSSLIASKAVPLAGNRQMSGAAASAKTTGSATETRKAETPKEKME